MVFSGLQSFADLLFTPVLAPLLALPPVLTLFIVALFVSVVSVLFQKYLTDQDRLKYLKKELKKFQKQMREQRDDPDKQMKLHKKMMPLQGEMMKSSLKPALWMMIPFLLLFLWLSANLAYLPLEADEEFLVEASVVDGVPSVLLDAPDGISVLSDVEASVSDARANWTLLGVAGEYSLSFTALNRTVTKDVAVGAGYEPPQESYEGPIRSVEVSNEKLTPLGDFSLFGWRPGWIALYIFFSLVLSLSLRRVLDVA